MSSQFVGLLVLYLAILLACAPFSDAISGVRWRMATIR